MSYDLMVFDADIVPRSTRQFMQWYRQQTQWAEDHDYDDPAVASKSLQHWFLEMAQHFPPLNGPLADEDCDAPEVTDHSIGHHLIYSAFNWEVAENAYSLMRELAIKHKVGFFDVSSEEGEILFPNENKDADHATSDSHSPWWKFW